MPSGIQILHQCVALEETSGMLAPTRGLSPVVPDAEPFPELKESIRCFRGYPSLDFQYRVNCKRRQEGRPECGKLPRRARGVREALFEGAEDGNGSPLQRFVDHDFLLGIALSVTEPLISAVVHGVVSTQRTALNARDKVVGGLRREVDRLNAEKRLRDEELANVVSNQLPRTWRLFSYSEQLKGSIGVFVRMSPMKHSFQSSDLFLRTKGRWCDIITSLYVLLESV